MTDSMEQNSWEINSSSVSQEISQIFRNQKVHYHARKSPSFVHVVS